MCNVCPMRDEALCTMHLKHVLKHSAMATHQRCVKNPSILNVHPLPEHYPLSCAGSKNDVHLDTMDFATSSDMVVNIDSPNISADYDVTIDLDSDPVVPVSELWNAISCSSFYNLGVNETHDLFNKLQCALASGESLFPMPLVPLTEEVGFDDEEESNFGVELAGKTLLLYFELSLFQSSDDPLTTKCHVNLNNPVSPDHPTFPWPSKAVCCQLSSTPYADVSYKYFVTVLLFSSPRLLFSEAQKKAILSWAKEFGARDVPSLYALNTPRKLYEHLLEIRQKRSPLIWETYSILMMLEKRSLRYV